MVGVDAQIDMQNENYGGLVQVESGAMTNSTATFIFPLDLKQVRSRRLSNGRLNLEEVPLVSGYGTHIVYIYVGSPPQRVSVIVDTGSHFTAFPCKGCRACGSHTDPYWDFDASITANTASCSDCRDTFKCGSHQRCVFSQDYSEGSSWSAFQVTDKVFIGPPNLADFSYSNAASFGIDFMFGCISSQTGLFNTQLADGIMGMSASEYTLPQQLHSAGLLKEEVFNLCFSHNGGYMMLGSNIPLTNTSEMTYTPSLHYSGWFTVKMIDIEVAGLSIGVNPSVYSRGKNTIVDSGTTDTYLPIDCANAFKAKWKSITNSEYSNSPMFISEEKMLKMPVLTFVFDGGARVDMLPKSYLEPNQGETSGYTPRIYLDEGMGAVLGANFMRDHDVLFDRTNKRIGFAPANCDWASLRLAKESLPIKAPNIQIRDENLAKDQNCATIFELIQTCNAKCSNFENATGIEIWRENYVNHIAENENGEKCLPLNIEYRPCIILCEARIEAENVECGTEWGPCTGDCIQSRHWHPPDFTSFTCQFQERTCHTGKDCSFSHMGLIVMANIQIELASTPIWSTGMSDSLSSEVASLLRVPSGVTVIPGDVEIFSVVKKLMDNDSANDGTELFDIRIGVHVGPVINEAIAAALASQFCAPGLDLQLFVHLSNDIDRQFGLTKIKSVQLNTENVQIVTASNRASFQLTGSHAQWREVGFGQSYSWEFPSKGIILVYFCIFALLIFKTRKRACTRRCLRVIRCEEKRDENLSSIETEENP